MTMSTVGYLLLGLIVLAAAFLGGMQYADQDSYSCQYVGGFTDSTVFEDKNDNTHKVLVKGNWCN